MAKFNKKIAESIAAKTFEAHPKAPFAYVTEDKQVFLDEVACNNYLVNSDMEHYIIKNPDVEVPKSDHEKLREELTAARKEADDTQEKLQQKDNEIEELKAELDEAQKTIDKAEGNDKKKPKK